MSSWIVCPCGNEIAIGGFPNAGVHRVISEHSYDAVTDPLDRNKLGVLFLQGRRLIECSRCGRLMIRGRNDTEYAVYVREPPDESKLPSDTPHPGPPSTT